MGSTVIAKICDQYAADKAAVVHKRHEEGDANGAASMSAMVIAANELKGRLMDAANERRPKQKRHNKQKGA